MKNYLLFAVVSILLFSCISGEKDGKFLSDSMGKPYEIFVVTSTEVFRGGVGDELKEVMEEEIHMISFSERNFQLLNVPTQSFKNVNRDHRNVMVLKIGKDYLTPKISTAHDVYSKPQLVTYLEAPDTNAMKVLIKNNGRKVFDIYNKEELKRFATKATAIADVKLKSEIASKFKISINLPKGYKIRDNSVEDFMWISYELPESSQGLLIYEYPYDNETITNSRIITERNKFVKNVPGELPGSYMTTADVFEPETAEKSIHGTDWYETRGFWRVMNDFQGGPFVSYTAVDKARNRVIVLDWYVYSPNPDKGQGTYIRQLEGIMETTTIMK